MIPLRCSPPGSRSAWIGYGLGALAPSLPIAILGVGVIAGSDGGLAANSTLSVLVAQLFRDRHGALFGLVGAATSAGSIVMLPVSRAALDIPPSRRRSCSWPSASAPRWRCST